MTVRYAYADRVARIKLARPEQSNRFNHTMMSKLAEAFARAADDNADLVLLSGAGADFSVGRERNEQLPPGITKGDNTALIVAVSHAMRDCPAIIVASVAGRAGPSLAWASAVRPTALPKRQARKA